MGRYTWRNRFGYVLLSTLQKCKVLFSCNKTIKAPSFLNCTRCRKFYPAEFVANHDSVPRCDCGGIVKPDVVLYEEPLDGHTVENAIAAIQRAELLIVAGTSLTVYPAAGLLDYYRGHRLVLINRDATAYDSRADLVFHQSLGEIFSGL